MHVCTVRVCIGRTVLDYQGETLCFVSRNCQLPEAIFFIVQKCNLLGIPMQIAKIHLYVRMARLKIVFVLCATKIIYQIDGMCPPRRACSYTLTDNPFFVTKVSACYVLRAVFCWDLLAIPSRLHPHRWEQYFIL